MSDKEPRRRKKRKDLQAARKEEILSDDHVFGSTKMETKDSDPDVEEEVSVPPHQPSVFAKFVFVLLFSGLVVSMSFVFISLQGSHRDDVDIFDDHHAEEPNVIHEFHHDSEHAEEEHGEVDHDEDDHGEAEHDDTETWSLPQGSFQENIEALLPGIGSIFSFNDESSKESESVLEEQDSSAHETLVDEESKEEDEPEVVDIKRDVRSTIVESTTDIDDLDEDDEELTSPAPTEIPPVTLHSPQEQAIETTEAPEYHSIPSDILPTQEPTEEDDTTPQSVIEDYTTYSPNTVPTAEDDEDDLPPTEESLPEEQKQTESPSEPDGNFIDPAEGDMEEESYYEKGDITNEADFAIRDQIDELEEALEKSPDRVLRKCEELLQLHKESPRLHYVRAQALDKLAELQRSNKLLEDAIAAYRNVMSFKSVPENLYLLAGKRAADRMRFRGFMGKSLTLLTEMAEKFPQNVELQNLVAVGYLMIGQNKKAKTVLNEVLKLSPSSGFAKVHLGFILKTDDSSYEEAIKFLSEGIASREPGVIDGRFYFHLGDALHRIGKEKEALQVYNEAVKEGLFLSAYQRSLYNVNGLTGKPWWNPQSTTYAPYFKILEKNWEFIRDEALSLTNEKISGFMPESEGLQEKGDWKQFELFARGMKIEKNCLKAPKTCALISQMPDAANCKRGQVKFSIMKPSTHVWAHTGPTNCRLRSHLGLVIPDGAKMRVANETRSWKEGKVLLFDDSFEHEVWHNGNTSRLILIVDFWHPELTAYQKKSLTPI